MENKRGFHSILSDKTNIFRWILFTLCVAGMIAVAVSTAFGDLFTLFFVPFKVDAAHVYSWVNGYAKTCGWVSSTYPPLYYLTIRAYLYFLTNTGLLSAKLFTGPCPFTELVYNRTFLFWAKLPYLIYHIASAVIFSRLFEKDRWKWFFFWLINPVALFVNFAEGQFDSIPTFFLLFSLYFIKGKKTALAALCLGLGAAFKHYPFLLVVPMAILLKQKFLEKVEFILIPICVYLTTLLISSNDPRLYPSLQFSENTKMLGPAFMIGGMSLSWYPLAYAALLITVLIVQKRNFDLLVIFSYLFAMLYFVITPNWSIQRVMFLLPMLMILSAARPKFRNCMFIFEAGCIAYNFVQFPGLYDHTLFRPAALWLSQINYNAKQIMSFDTAVNWIIRIMLLAMAFFAVREKSREPVRPPKFLTMLAHGFSFPLYMLIMVALLWISHPK